MTSMKGSLSAAWIFGPILLTLPAAGCNVSSKGLGNQFDAADGPKQRPEASPAAISDASALLPEVGSQTPSDGAAEAAPSAATDLAPSELPDASPDREPSVEAASTTVDLASRDTASAADVPFAYEVQILPDVPLAMDGTTDLPPPQVDSADGSPTVSLDGPAIDTAPDNSAPPDLAPADLARDLSVFPDLPAPDLAPADVAPQPTVNWVVDSTTSIGGFTPTVMGTPTVTAMDAGTAVCFDGTQDGLLLATNPLQGMQKFTIQTLVYPEFTGTDDPRLIHLGDSVGNTPRLVIQMRANVSGSWHVYVSFYRNNIPTNLEATTNNHASNQWYWLAVTYDGQTASVYVNGVLETSDTLTFGPMVAGSTSLGTRQNGQYYFPGCMREVEFFNSALPASQLSKP
jgi:hypothetical protein